MRDSFHALTTNCAPPISISSVWGGRRKETHDVVDGDDVDRADALGHEFVKVGNIPRHLGRAGSWPARRKYTLAATKKKKGKKRGREKRKKKKKKKKKK